VIFCGGDPQIDALAKTAIAKIQDLGAHLEIALAVCDGVLQISITVATPTT
jgi:hypothetical protein